MWMRMSLALLRQISPFTSDQLVTWISNSKGMLTAVCSSFVLHCNCSRMLLISYIGKRMLFTSYVWGRDVIHQRRCYSVSRSRKLISIVYNINFNQFKVRILEALLYYSAAPYKNKDFPCMPFHPAPPRPGPRSHHKRIVARSDQCPAKVLSSLPR